MDMLLSEAVQKATSNEFQKVFWNLKNSVR